MLSVGLHRCRTKGVFPRGFIDHLFSADGFMPHGHCYLWRPGVLWLHIVSDALITLAYFSIPCVGIDPTAVLLVGRKEGRQRRHFFLHIIGGRRHALST